MGFDFFFHFDFDFDIGIDIHFEDLLERWERMRRVGDVWRWKLVCVGVRSRKRSDHGYDGGGFCGMVMCFSFSLFPLFCF